MLGADSILITSYFTAHPAIAFRLNIRPQVHTLMGVTENGAIIQSMGFVRPQNWKADLTARFPNDVDRVNHSTIAQRMFFSR